MLLRLLLINKNYHNLGQNSIKSSFFAKRPKKALVKGRSPQQELEGGPRSGPLLLVLFLIATLFYIVFLSSFLPQIYNLLCFIFKYLRLLISCIHLQGWYHKGSQFTGKWQVLYRLSHCRVVSASMPKQGC